MFVLFPVYHVVALLIYFCVLFVSLYLFAFACCLVLISETYRLFEAAAAGSIPVVALGAGYNVHKCGDSYRSRIPCAFFRPFSRLVCYWACQSRSVGQLFLLLQAVHRVQRAVFMAIGLG